MGQNLPFNTSSEEISRPATKANNIVSVFCAQPIKPVNAPINSWWDSLKIAFQSILQHQVNICLNLQVSISKQVHYKYIILILLQIAGCCAIIQAFKAFLPSCFRMGWKKMLVFFNSYISGNPLKTSRHYKALLEYSRKCIQLWWSSISSLFPFINRLLESKSTTQNVSLVCAVKCLLEMETATYLLSTPSYTGKLKTKRKKMHECILRICKREKAYFLSLISLLQWQLPVSGCSVFFTVRFSTHQESTHGGASVLHSLCRWPTWPDDSHRPQPGDGSSCQGHRVSLWMPDTLHSITLMDAKR